MANIIESATLNDIAQYLQREDGCNAKEAQQEAERVLHDFQDMQARGLIKGWYFNELGQLELLPSDHALDLFGNKK